MIKKELLRRSIPNFFEGIDTKEKWKNEREKIKELFWGSPIRK